MSVQGWERDRYGLTLRLAMGVVLCVEWVEQGGGPRRWRWTLEHEGYGGRASRMATGEPCASEGEAQVAGLVAAAELGKLITAIAESEARRIKQAAQDADDAALVAPVEPAWLVHDAGHAILHAAVVAGHKCLVSVQPSGHVKWELEPEHERHPYTWDAPDLETAKIRASAAALRTPCKRWLVEIPDQTLGQREIKGGAVEVWAVTSEGALYRACEALEIRSFGRTVKGNVMEVRL